MPPSAPRAQNTRAIVDAAVPELGPGASYETTSDREVTLFEDVQLLSSSGPSLGGMGGQPGAKNRAQKAYTGKK